MPDSSGGGRADAIRARAFWSGTISFGLVSIPVNLFAATRGRRVSLRMLDDDGTPLARRYYDPASGAEVPRERLVRGYEIEEDEFVVVTDEELDALEPDRTRDIDLRRFVDRDAIDPIYFERAYFLTPAGSSSKAYRLLAAVMERTSKAGIATFVMRTREYLVAILSDHGILRAETLRFADEIRPVEEIDLPPPPSLEKGRVRAVEEAVKEATQKGLDTSELEDRYADRLLALVERKKQAGDAVVRASPELEVEEGDGDVIDLMEVLKRSLGGSDADARKGSRRAGPRRTDPDGGELSELTKSELYEKAQQLEIAGRSSMNKRELIRAIRKSA